MKKQCNKLILLVIVLCTCLQIAYSQNQTVTYYFKINISNNVIQETEPESLNGHINYTNHNTINDDLIPLFKFSGSDASVTPVSLLVNKKMGQLSFQFRHRSDRESPSQRSLYNLFYTKARLHNGDNILKLEVSPDLIWVTCNSGTIKEDLIVANDRGEGVLWFNNLSLFIKDNIHLESGVTLLGDPVTSVRPRRSIENEPYFNDPVYGEYGYNDVNVMQPLALGNALDFDGVDDYVAIDPGVYFNGDFTIEAWVKPRTYNTWSRIIDFGNGNDADNIALAIAGSNNYPFLSIGVYSACYSTIQLQLNQWNHIAATLNGTTATLYINGKFAGSATLPAANNVMRNNCYIGKSRVSYDAYANATMDEIRIWNTARTQSQIQASMSSELTGAEPGLVCYYDCNNGLPCANNQGTVSLHNMVNFPDVLPPPMDSTIIYTNPPPSGPILILAEGEGSLNNFTLNGSMSNWVLGVTPQSTDTICVGNTVQYGNYIEGGIWSSRDAAIASVDSTGEVTGIAGGTTIIDYTYTLGGSCTATSSTEITVNVPSHVFTNTGNALSFDSYNNQLLVKPGVYFNGDFTIEGWAYLNSNSENGSIVDFGNSWDDIRHSWANRIGLDINLNVNRVTLDVEGSSFSSNNELVFNQWNHIAATLSGNIATIYINGIFNGSVILSRPTNVFRNSCLVGQSRFVDIFQPPQYINHTPYTIDEVRIWNIALSQGQIQGNMNRELTGTETGLIAYYNFNQGIANGRNTGITTVIDKTPNQNNGTLYGFALTGNASNWVSGIVQDSSTNLCAGSILQLNNAALGGFWSTTNPSVASVNAATGVVNGLAAGSATINYTTYSGSTCPNVAATVINVSGLVTASNTGNSLRFDGGNDYAANSEAKGLNFDSTNAITAEAWVRFSPTNFDLWLSLLQNGSIKYRFGFTPNRQPFWNMGEHADVVLSSIVLDTNRWYHMAFVGSSDPATNKIATKVYVNGMLTGSYLSGLTNLTPAGQMYIGCGESPSSHNFSGNIDELRIWNVARTQSQLQASMNGELSGYETGLVAYYNFNQGIAGGSNVGVTTLIDKSRNANNATLNSFTLTGTGSNWMPGIVADSTITLNACTVSQLNNNATGGVWSSSNISVATVDASGLVSALTAGNATIQYTIPVSNSCPLISTTIVNVTEPAIANNTGNALSFDGIDDYVNVPNSNSLQFTDQYTLEAWIKPEMNGKRILDKVTAGYADGPFTFDTYNGLRLIIGLTNGQYALTTNNTLPLNAWTHVAATCDAGNGIVKLYVNGLLVASGNFSGTLRNSSFPLRIGAPGNGSTNGIMFKGLIDEVRIWKNIRSQQQLLANMNQELAASDTTGLLAYYNFNQGVAAGSNTGVISLLDGSSNAISGTLNGFALSGSTSNWVAGKVVVQALNLNRCTSIQLNNPVSGGIWSSTDTTVALVSSSGVVTGITAGSATINYAYSTSGSCFVNSATTVGVSSPAITKNKGNGLNFDGVNDYIAVKPGTYFNGNFTIEAWVKPTSYNTWSRVIDFGNGNDVNNIALAIAGGNNYPFLSIGVSYSCYSTIQLQLNQWNHIAATLNGTTATMYINGVFAGSATLPVPASVLRNYCYIGKSRVSSDAYANATMDEVRIWNIARTQSQIQQAMNISLSGTEPGLLAYYDFNQGTAGSTNTGIDSLMDRTQNANNGLLNNFALSGTSSNWMPGNIPSSTIMLYPTASFQLNNATAGGVWSSDNLAAATVSSAGVVTAVASGFATITYSVPVLGSCSVAATTDVIVGNAPVAKSSMPNIPVLANIEAPVSTLIRIYPNPVHNRVSVLLAQGMENATITLTSVLGSKVVMDNQQGLQRSINLLGMPAGVYFVVITLKDNTKSYHKLLIN